MQKKNAKMTQKKRKKTQQNRKKSRKRDHKRHENKIHKKREETTKHTKMCTWVTREPRKTKRKENAKICEGKRKTQKNAILKQFRELFKLDGVKLEFAKGSLDSIAAEAMTRKTGARGIRTVIEETLLDVMYDLPSREDVERCIITAKSISKNSNPILVTKSGVPLNAKKKDIPKQLEEDIA